LEHVVLVGLFNCYSFCKLVTRSLAPAVEVEHVAKDLGALSGDERMAALLADAPELLALIEDLTASISEVRHRVGPLLQEVSPL
jgi:hypothetical protein